MLCLLTALLPWALLCLASPVPLESLCPNTSLFLEAMADLKNLQNSTDHSEILPLNDVVGAGENAATYLEGFIETLRKTKQSTNQQLLISKLQKIQTYGESCHEWKAALKEHHWEAVKEKNFFTNLEDLLRFLGHNALP